MSAPLYQSKLEAIGDALAVRIAAAPVLAAEGCEVVSRVDDSIASRIEERVKKAGGLLGVVAFQGMAPSRSGGGGRRRRVTWNLSLWARRIDRKIINSGPVLLEALDDQIQDWKPEGSLCYDMFNLVTASQVPHKRYSLYEATFAAEVLLGAPTLAPV